MAQASGVARLVVVLPATVAAVASSEAAAGASEIVMLSEGGEVQPPASH